MQITITELITVIGVLFALITSLTLVLEFKRQGTQKRAELFSRKLKEMWQNDLFKEIWFYLDTNDEDRIKAIKRQDKLAYLVIFDEVAIMMNSGLIKKEVAYYMFGYFVITAWENEAFWSDPGIDRSSVYWSVLRNFVLKMKEIDISHHDHQKIMKF